jgi:Carboxypeptidase regulatory-like domain/TonB dependent receptor-like, beta-barrel
MVHHSVRKQWCVVEFLLVLLVIAASPALWAQTAGTGALTGTITDSSRAVVPNATVTATNLDTGQNRTAMTGADGTYKINLLPPGNYRVKVEAAGFKAVEIPSATVNVTETEVLDRSLEVGSQTQAVTVEAEVEVIQTASSALGTVASSRTVTELPLNTRNYTNLLAMSAGTTSPVQNATSLGKGSSLISANGASNFQNTFLQDGVDVGVWLGLGTGTEGTAYASFSIPNPDAIAEFKIQTSSYDAGYGRHPGANVNVITKFGTNSLHGSAFEFFRNTVLNANEWFYKRSELNAGLPDTNAVLNSNVYGGVVGGPVKKDKLFFFASYQETDQKNGLSGYGFSTPILEPIPLGDRGTCPTPSASLTSAAFFAACNTAAQNFITKMATGFSPAAPCSSAVGKTGGATAAGAQVQCPGTAGATDSLFNINPVAISLLQLQLPGGGYLIPSSLSFGGAPNSTQAVSFSHPAIFKDHQFMGNFDYVLNSRETVSGRYEYETDPTHASFPVINATLAGTSLPGTPVTATKLGHSALLKLTSILSNTLVNEARISFQRYNAVNSEGDPFTDTQVGVTPLNPAPSLNGLSYFNVGGSGTNCAFFCFGSHYFFLGTFPSDQYEVADQISWSHGKHSIRTGFEVERVQSDTISAGGSYGDPTTLTWGDFLIGRGGCGAGTVNAGCNGTTTSNISSPGSNASYANFPYEFRDTIVDAYVQDDLKLTSRLTVNAGLRWEYDGWPVEKYGEFANLWQGLANTVPVPVLKIPPTAASLAANSTMAGFVVPSNYGGPVPSGVYVSNTQFPTPSHAPYDDFAPRLGFAWQPLASSKWVLRGGAGFFYDQLNGQLIGGTLFADTPGVGVPLGLAPTATLASPFVLPPTLPGPPGGFGFTPRWVTTAGASSGISQVTIAQNLTVPLTYEWNLNTQYQFLPTWVLELGYVGSHGIHQPSNGGQTGSGQASAYVYNLAQLVGVGSPCINCQATTNLTSNTALRTPLLGVSPTDTMVQTNLNYEYNGLQATVRKQLSRGLQLQAAYTWSRSFLQSPFGINTYPYLIDVNGPNPVYRPQRLVINYVWNLPLGHQQGFLGKLTSGWTWSGVTTFQDGQPLTITDSTGGTIFGTTAASTLSTAQFCPGMSTANLLTSGSLTQRVTGGLTPGGIGYFNGKAQGVLCASPTVGQIGGVGGGPGFGSSGLGIVLGPGQNNWDMSLAKLISIHEAQSIQFRAEFFNTFNHPQFANPNTNAASPTFGVINSTSVSPRVIQFALKYAF